MNRRTLLAATSAALITPRLATAAADGLSNTPSPSRVRPRPGDPGWPTVVQWELLRHRVDGRLVAGTSPLAVCRDGDTADCRALFASLKNPYAVGDSPMLTQTCGWVGAWTSQPSAYVIAARTAGDVAEGVGFARRHHLRLVIRGGGHSYLGTSNAPDSLMIWTRAMSTIRVLDAFVPQGAGPDVAPQPAVAVGAGAIWMHVYDAVTTKAGRYVQGGGCGTVGVAGLVQGGGFGTYSKRFGLAGAALLEAEVVTADGAVRVVNAYRDRDLFWALKGGGGGTFAVVTQTVLRTRELPGIFGHVSCELRAPSDEAYRRLVDDFIAFYAEHLFNPHWGELVTLHPGRGLSIGMNWQGLTEDDVKAMWQTFFDRVASRGECTMTPPVVISGPGRYRWDAAALDRFAPGAVLHDDRPNAPPENVFWSANLAEAGHVLQGFESVWLPADLLQPRARSRLVASLATAATHWTVELHFQKGLAGAPAEEIAAARDTPMNPAVCDAFTLAIMASEGPPAFPEIAGHMPDVGAAERNASRIALATAELRQLTTAPGAYVAESGYFQSDWANAYWGRENYGRLLEVKRRYDPDELFFVRHGVGSEAWSGDGFTRTG
jgi:FAD/FMN-containing dehydrogenase